MTTHYIVYRSTNLTNGMIYVGSHTMTGSPADATYFGPTEILPDDAFSRTTLRTFDNSTDASAYERKIVNDAFVGDPNTYNTAPPAESKPKIVTDFKHRKRSNLEAVPVPVPVPVVEEPLAEMSTPDGAFDVIKEFIRYHGSATIKMKAIRDALVAKGYSAKAISVLSDLLPKPPEGKRRPAAYQKSYLLAALTSTSRDLGSL